MKCALPFAEGFYNNPGIIDKKSIIAIQNVDDQEEGCLES
jgi:hypothetical protein